MLKPAAPERISFADYLESEETSKTRHELVDGWLYAMTGTSRAHNRITGNLYIALRQRLKGSGCRVWMENVKLRLDALAADSDGYYPDVIVTCEKDDNHPLYVAKPILVAEVLSPSTARLDRGEKLNAYRKINGLRDYLIIAQDAPQVDHYRYAAGWACDRLNEADTIALPALGISIPTAELYVDD